MLRGAKFTHDPGPKTNMNRRIKAHGGGKLRCFFQIYIGKDILDIIVISQCL